MLLIAKYILLKFYQGQAFWYFSRNIHNLDDAYCQTSTKIDLTKNVHLKIEPVFSPNTFYIPFCVGGFCLLCTGQLIFGNGVQGLEK